MKGNRAVIAAIVVVVLAAAGWWLFGRGGRSGAVNLIERFPQATKAPATAPFETIDVNLAGESHKALFAPAPTRITWRVKVPDDAWLRVWVGMKEESWKAENDGAYFLVGVSDGKTFEPLFTQHVHPFANQGDRKWIPVYVDLSAYAGEEMDLIFNTRSGVEGKSGNFANNLPLWGEPELVIR
jgi:hypothetical protein